MSDTLKSKSAKTLFLQIQDSEEQKSFLIRDFHMWRKNLKAANWTHLWRWKVTKNLCNSQNFQSWISKNWWRRRLRPSRSKRPNSSHLSKIFKKASRDRWAALLFEDSKMATHQQKLWPLMTIISSFRSPSTGMQCWIVPIYITILLFSSTKTAPKIMKTCATYHFMSKFIPNLDNIVSTPSNINKSMKCSDL